MDNQQIRILIGILLEEDHDRNFMRIQRKRLRDHMNPFDMSDIHFTQLFRLDKQSVINLIDHIIIPHISNRNNNSISVTKRVLITLHFLSVGSHQNSVGTNCWLSASQPTVSRSINEICLVITQHLLPNWINEEIVTVKQAFYRKFGFRGLLGAIDGTHVEILAPPSTDENHPPFVYINRKSKHSINVMLICDAQTKILGCNARFPGSVHDSAIWQLSTIRAHLQRKYEEGDQSSHLIEDSGYPLEPWLFTPFTNPRNRIEEVFNQMLTSSRNVIERTNGVLKGRFRCLSRHRTLIYHPTKAANIIYSCCVLHNIAQHAGIYLNEEEIEYREPDIEQDNEAGINNHVRNYFQLGTEARTAYIRNNFN